MDSLRTKLDGKDYNKLMGLGSRKINEFIKEYISLCNPAKVFIRSGDPVDTKFIMDDAVRTKEERELAIEGHTLHFDGYYDQGRDKEHTRFLVPEGLDLGPLIHSMNKDEGIKEVKEILRDSMVGHTMYVLFFVLGPADSEFSIPAIQITDSSYVAHSLDLLYRNGYASFKKIGDSGRFFRFVHSVADLDLSRRRIYIDTEDGIAFSTNTEYGGNTLGLKKPALRLAIAMASKEGWLAEHMFIVGINGPNGRKTYLTGAFPSGCGKTSTSMMEGETIIGDDLVYLRKREGRVYAANPERGVFGIVNDINSREEPILWETLHKQGEIIFSNVLVGEDNLPYWSGKDGRLPVKGLNYSGEWFEGKIDAEGNEIPMSHKNSRFTFNMDLLRNRDVNVDNPDGVAVGGIIYGGRDSDTSVPVQESFTWVHGVTSMGASLESETTAATLGEVGIRKFNPMSNLDFISIPIGRYIQNNLAFGRDLKGVPPIFSVNYFLKNDNNRFLNDKKDKRVWLRWIELRSHGEVDAIETPTGRIPRYEDLKKLFSDVLDKDYLRKDYVEQFTIRVPESLSKIERIINIYNSKVPDAPDALFEVLKEQRSRLEEAQRRFGDYIPPEEFMR